MSDNVRFVEVPVRIPNLERDGTTGTQMVRVPMTIDPHTGEELLTEEAVELIDNAKARSIGSRSRRK
jgi:hypothetical protein